MYFLDGLFQPRIFFKSYVIVHVVFYLYFYLFFKIYVTFKKKLLKLLIFFYYDEGKSKVAHVT